MPQREHKEGSITVRGVGVLMVLFCVRGAAFPCNHLVLFQGNKSGFSVPVVFRGKAQCADDGRLPCQALQRGRGAPQERPKGWSVSAHGKARLAANDLSPLQEVQHGHGR